MTNLTRTGIEDELVTIIKTITGLGDDYVRVSYQEKGQPTFSTTDNVIYIAVTLFDTKYDKPIETTYTNSLAGITETKTMVAGVDARLTLYGDDAQDNALKIKAMVTKNSIMKTLRAGGVYLINATSSPQRLPILLNQQWYEQVTMDLKFYQNLTYTSAINPIESAEITFETDIGTEKTIEIKEI